MGRRRKTYGFLNRQDHRLDMSPVGRNLFISRDKQLQHQAAKRIRMWSKVVITLVLIGVLGAGLIVGFFYMAPWFHSEITAGVSGSPSASSEPESSLPASHEFDAMGLVIYDTSVCLFAVNRNAPAGPDFSPELAEAGGVQVDARIAPALRMLVAAAKSDGLALKFTDGYVSYDVQEKRFEDKVKELRDTRGLTTVMAREEAATLEPKPGESDMQSGMCARLDGDPATFGESRTYSWLKTNMGKYGFVFRYPDYKESFTGMGFDPTVIRYVGSECATAMQQRSMCLEEYVDYLSRQ